MRHYIFTLFIIGITQISICQTDSTPVISNIKAYLYYNQNKYEEKVEGTFSENIIENAKFPLWNTMIGEGSASGYSNNTFIVAEIFTPKPSKYNSFCIRIIVTDEASRVIFSRKVCGNMFSSTKSYSIPFLINETGCSKWKIKVDLFDLSEKKRYSKMVKEIEFACGE